MLIQFFQKIDGWKFHIVNGLGVLVVIIGHFWGPINAGPIQIGSYDWSAVWDYIQKAGLLSAGRDAFRKLQTGGTKQ